MAKTAFVQIHDDIWVRPSVVHSVSVAHPGTDEDTSDAGKYVVRVKVERGEGWFWEFDLQGPAQAFMARIIAKLLSA